MATQLKAYENFIEGIKMDYPAAWIRQDNAAGAVVTFSPQNEDSIQNPSLNIVVQDLSTQPLNLEEFTSVSIYQMEQMLSDIREMNVVDTKVANLDGKNITYITTLQETQLKFRQVFTLKDHVAYIITFSCPSAQYEAHTNLIDTCILTFTFIPKRGLNSVSLQPFLNKEYAYFIRVPKGWTPQKIKEGSVYRFDKPKDSKVSLIVVVDYFAADSLDAYTKLVKSQFSQVSINAANIVDTTLAGIPAKRASFYSPSLLLPGKYQQVWTVRDKFVGVITLVHEVEENDEQNEYAPLFERILESFSFVRPDYILDPSYRYDNFTLGFSINYPERFQPQEGFMGATVSFVVPADQHNHTFGTNINVVVQRMPTQVTLEVFCDTIKQQLEHAVADIETTSEAYLQIAGTMGKEYQYSGKIENQRVRFVQRVAILGDKAIVLSFAVEKEKYDREYRTVGKYLDTFKLF